MTKFKAPFCSSKILLQFFMVFSNFSSFVSNSWTYWMNSFSLFTSFDAFALNNNPYISLKFLIEGPVIVGTLYIVASRGLWPPVLLKLPPINAISHIAYVFFNSPNVNNIFVYKIIIFWTITNTKIIFF